MFSKNTVELRGNLGKDPEIRVTSGGTKVAWFDIATNAIKVNAKTGERLSVPSWHRIAVWNSYLIDNVAAHLKKGALINVTGKLNYRSITDINGNKGQIAEIVVGNDGDLHEIKIHPKHTQGQPQTEDIEILSAEDFEHETLTH